MEEKFVVFEDLYWKNVEGDGYIIMKVLFPHLPGGTEQKNVNPQVGPCPITSRYKTKLCYSLGQLWINDQLDARLRYIIRLLL